MSSQSLHEVSHEATPPCTPPHNTQFDEQNNAMAAMLDQYTQRLAQLVDENSALRKENEQLRKMY